VASSVWRRRPGHRQPARQQHHGLCRRSERGRRAHSGRAAQGPLRDRHAAVGKPAEFQTCREAGIDIVFHFWPGVVVPKGTPGDRVATRSEGFGKLVKDEGFLWLMKAIHSNIAYLDHTTFAEYLTGEQKQLKELYETMKK